MEKFEVYKQTLLDYLHVEKKMEEQDIEASKQMTRNEKIESGLMIANLTIESSHNGDYILSANENYSKLRSGDKVILRKVGDDVMIKAIIIDTNLDTITVSTESILENNVNYDLEIDNPNLLNSLIGCLEGIVPATPGAAFLRMLAGEESVESESFLSLKPEDIAGFNNIYMNLNTEQRDAVNSMLKFYPIHVLQGPPGTGKTIVLAATAIAASLMNREVVIISNTHQAVNNALMRISQLNPNIPLFKIGEILKSEGLDKSIYQFQKFTEYNEYSKKNRRKKDLGYIVGMTIWGAISNLGLRTNSHFRPYLALVDEASLMPLTYASILGKCSSTICFFGDSRQMPPIFRPELEDNKVSISILDYCATNIRGVPVKILLETHRMNKDITDLVSKSFYEPYGITLRSAECISANKYCSQFMDYKGLYGSIVFADTKLSSLNCKEENEGEAESVINLVKGLLEEGKNPEDMAIITPFRKQVILIRAKIKKYIKYDVVPLIDTVERLQGKDVDCIILSFASSDNNYINEIHDFLFNPHRLNVMISRAKTKVIIYACNYVQMELKKIIVTK